MASFRGARQCKWTSKTLPSDAISIHATRRPYQARWGLERPGVNVGSMWFLPLARTRLGRIPLTRSGTMEFGDLVDVLVTCLFVRAWMTDYPHPDPMDCVAACCVPDVPDRPQAPGMVPRYTQVMARTVTQKWHKLVAGEGSNHWQKDTTCQGGHRSR